MTAPVRFPSGISTFPTRNALSTFPGLPSPNAAANITEFMPYRGTADFTVTTTTASVAPATWPAGLLTFSNTASASSKAAIAMNGNVAAGQSLQIVPGFQTWFNVQVGLGVASLTDTNVYVGLFDNADPTAATSGVYFFKPSGGTAVNLVMKRLFAGVTTTTTINNVADMAKPSGIYGDTSSSVGTVTATQSGGYYNTIAVGTAGSGYASSPVLVATGATGTGAQGLVSVQSGSLYAPYLQASGSAYTTAAFEVDHLIDFSITVDAKGTLTAAVNGKAVVSIGAYGANSLAPGATQTTNLASYQCSTLPTTSLMPVQPLLGSCYAMTPGACLVPAVAMANTTGNVRTLYLETFQAAQEFF